MFHRTNRPAVCAVVAAAVLAAPVCLGAEIVVLLRENDVIAEGEVTTINNPAVNHVGGWGLGITTDANVSRFWGNATGGAGAVMRSEQTIGDYEQTSFESFWGMADDGAIGYSPSSTQISSGTTGLDGVFLGDLLVMIEEQPVTGEPYFWSFGSRPGTTAGGTPYWVGGWTSVQGGSTEIRGLFFGTDATPLYLAGGAVCDLPFPLGAGSSIDFDYRFSASGDHHLVPVTMNTGSTTDDGTLILDDCGLMIDGNLVREASPVPAVAGGLAGENWDNFDYVGVNDAGTWFFTGDTDADTALDEIIVKDGVIIIREGDTVDGVQLSGAMETAYMNDDADIAYVWDYAIVDDTLEALFLNEELLLSEGDEIDFDGDGQINDDATISGFVGIASLAVGDRIAGVGTTFVDVYCTADVDTLGTPSTSDDTEVALRVRVTFGGGCTADVDGNGSVNVDDLLIVLAEWGDCPGCQGDVNGDDVVDVNDLLEVLAQWGPC